MRVYASPNMSKRREIWGALNVIKESVQGAWCVGGDFNAILYEDECRSNLSYYSSVDNHFVDSVDEARLGENHTVGHIFTWSRENREIKLNKILANEEFFSYLSPCWFDNSFSIQI